MALTPQEELELLMLAEAESQSTQQPPSMLEKAGEAAQSITEKGAELLSPLQKLMRPVGQAAEMAQERLDPMTKASLGAVGGLQQAFQKGGEQTAEALAGEGLRMDTVGGVPFPRQAREGEEGLQASPEVAALIGTGIQMTPDIAAILATPGVMSSVRSVISRDGAAQAGQFVKNVAKRIGSKAGAPIRGAKRIKTAFEAPTAQEIRDAARLELETMKQQAPIASRAERVIGEDVGRVQRELSQLQRKQAELKLARPAGEEAAKAAKGLEAERAAAESNFRKQLETFKKQKRGLPEREQEMLAQRQGQLKEAGSEIGKIEAEAGIQDVGSPGFARLAKSPKRLEKLATKLEGEDLSTKTPRQLQKRRKLAEELSGKQGGLTKITKRKLLTTGTKAGRQLDEALPGFKEARQTWKQTKGKVKGTKAEFGKRRAQLQNVMGKVQNEMKDQLGKYDRIIKEIKAAKGTEVSKAQKQKAVALEKELIKKRADLQETQRAGKNLMQDAKQADQNQLSDVKIRYDKLIQEADQNAKIRLRTKAAIITALGAAGLFKLIPGARIAD